jgi:hypothetical protein
MQVFDGEYFEFSAIVALIFAGTFCLVWGDAPAASYTELTTSSQVDTLQRQRPQRRPFIWAVQGRQGDLAF